jgi:hypothetical protein
LLLPPPPLLLLLLSLLVLLLLLVLLVLLAPALGALASFGAPPARQAAAPNWHDWVYQSACRLGPEAPLSAVRSPAHHSYPIRTDSARLLAWPAAHHITDRDRWRQWLAHRVSEYVAGWGGRHHPRVRVVVL